MKKEKKSSVVQADAKSAKTDVTNSGKEKWMVFQVRHLISQAGPRALDAVHRLSQMDLPAPAKNLYALWFLQNRTNDKTSLLGKNQKVTVLRHSSQFQAFVKEQIQEARGRFQISGMVSVMAAVILIYFGTSVLREEYVINFSVDAILASIAFAFLLVNLRSMLNAAALAGCRRECIIMDLCAFGLCLLAKTVLPAAFDGSLFILIAVYFLERYRFDQAARKTVDAMQFS